MPRSAVGIPETQESQWCKFQAEFKSEGGRRPISQLEDSLVEVEFSLTQPFCSVQALSGLDRAHSRGRGQFAFLSLQTPMLISSSTHPPVHRITVDQMAGHPGDPVKLARPTERSGFSRSSSHSVSLGSVTI